MAALAAAPRACRVYFPQSVLIVVLRKSMWELTFASSNAAWVRSSVASAPHLRAVLVRGEGCRAVNINHVCNGIVSVCAREIVCV